MKTGIQLIADERQEQLTKHGRTVQMDVEQNHYGQLGDAASILCTDDWGCNTAEDMVDEHCPQDWNEALFERMVKKPYKERLIIAGALIAAQIDRLLTEDRGV